MNSDELIEILKEFHNTRYDKLEGEPKRLFDAIMKIADERDMYKQEIKNAKKYINEYLDANEENEQFVIFGIDLLAMLGGDNNE